MIIHCIIHLNWGEGGGRGNTKLYSSHLRCFPFQHAWSNSISIKYNELNNYYY